MMPDGTLPETATRAPAGSDRGAGAAAAGTAAPGLARRRPDPRPAPAVASPRPAGPDGPGSRAAVVARINATARAHPGRLLPPLRLARRLRRARALPRRGRGAADRPRPRLRRRGAALRARSPPPPAAPRPLRPPRRCSAPPPPAPVRLAVPHAPAPELRARGRGRGHGRHHRRLRPAAGAAAGLRGPRRALRFLCFTDRPTRRPGLDDAAAGGGEPRPGRRPGRRHRLPQDPRRGGARRGGARRRAPRSGSTPTASSSATSTPCSPAGCCRRTSRSGGTPDSDWRAMAERHLVARHGPGGGGHRPGRGLRGRAACPATAAAATPAWSGAGTTPPGVAALTEAWWAALAGGARRRRPRALPRARRGPGGAACRPARSCPRRSGAPPTTSSSPAAPAAAGAPPARPAAPPARPLPVVFLSAARFANFASTFLRGRQLSATGRRRLPRRYAVRFTEDAGGVRDAVVVLTKGAMRDARRRGDRRPRPAQHRHHRLLGRHPPRPGQGAGGRRAA